MKNIILNLWLIKKLAIRNVQNEEYSFFRIDAWNLGVKNINIGGVR